MSEVVTSHPVDESFAAEIARQVDRTFIGAMAMLRQQSGLDVVARHGGFDVVGGLVEFRSSLARTGRIVTGRQWRAVWRYRDVDDGERWIASRVASGSLARAADGFTATTTGRAFLRDASTAQDRVLGPGWNSTAEPLLAPLEDVLAAASRSAGDSFAAVMPAYELAGAGPGWRLLQLLTGIRYHRADAHAAAWASHGLTAADMVALPDGELRRQIESDTNRRAGVPWSALDGRRRSVVLAGLSSLPV